jgi:hypothetical protein
VGPRTSFVLWEQMSEEIIRFLASKSKVEASAYHVLFAGGIHDALSASMVATLAAPMAELGVRIGISMGTGYIFTTEAVSTGPLSPLSRRSASPRRRYCSKRALATLSAVPIPYRALFNQRNGVVR